jgi:DNA modification methylase
MIEPIQYNSFLNQDLSFFVDNLSLPRHRWYDFKEGFSQRLVREALGEVSSGSERLRILEPFAGSGTTLVTAGLFGHEATGIEVNPFLAFATQAKCIPSGGKLSLLEEYLKFVLEVSKHEMPSPLEGLSTFTEQPNAKRWLFNRSVLRGFTAIDKALADLTEHVGKFHAPLRLALFGSLIECCNAKRDGKCFRYRKGWEHNGLTSENLRAAFTRRARVMLDDMIKYPFDHRNLRLMEGDARKHLKELETHSHDLMITSPPYLNSFDYSDVYRPELFAGGFVRTNEELRQIRLRTVRSHVQVNWEPSSEISSPMLPPLLKAISSRKLWDRRLPAMVQSYFSDMAQILEETSRIVRPNGQAWIVVGTSAYGGLEIPVDLILADIGSRSGWNLKGVYVLRRLRAAGQFWSHLKPHAKAPLRESLVILKR